MIHDAGFLGSEHRVVTPDGYILTMHRILSPNPRYMDFDQLSAVSIVQQEDINIITIEICTSFISRPLQTIGFEGFAHYF